MRIAFLGGGSIARLALETIFQGRLEGFAPVAILGRSAVSPARDLATRFGVSYVLDRAALIAAKPDVLVEAASHEAVREHAAAVLEAGISMIVMSGGVLADDALREQLEQIAQVKAVTFCVPSGGIGGLDALKAVVAAGCESVEITVSKPPDAWRGVPFVEKLGVRMEQLVGPRILFEGTAREGVRHFPQNVNIAAVLSMAGVGFDRTRLKVVAEPGLERNTHTILVNGTTGTITLKFESVPFPENAKTSMLACYSALAALRAFRAPVRYGT